MRTLQRNDQFINDLLNDRRVAVIKEIPTYCSCPPYHPSEEFPEWRGFYGWEIGKEDNPAYRAIRKVFLTLGFDSENYGSTKWNPLKELIKPGDSVVIKPNWVVHKNQGEKVYGETDTDCLITHGSVIRAVLDYVCRALEGDGCVIIADCPIQDTDWDALLKLTRIYEVRDYINKLFPGVGLEIRDYRVGQAEVKGNRITRRITLKSKLDDYEEIDLGSESLLAPITNESTPFGVANYGFNRLKHAHNQQHHYYLLPRDIINASVFINLPKLKTHKKAGLTCALKNLVGVVGLKDYLPHFRIGSPKNGGDEYPDYNWLWDLRWWFGHKEWELEGGILKQILWLMERACGLAFRFSRSPGEYQSVSDGSWYGNDTLWRTILDLNIVLLYSSNKKYLAIADGLIAGHKESPLCPTPLPSGLCLGGKNPVALDAVASALLGFDFNKIQQIREGFCLTQFPLVKFSPHDIEIVGLPEVKNLQQLYDSHFYIQAEPSFGWKGHIEYVRRERGHD